MIKILSYENVALNHNLYLDQFKLRFREFVERQDYEVKNFRGMEYDQYDTPATCYLIHSSDGKTVNGVSRLIPTTQRCMLNDFWPDLVEDKSLLSNSEVWESTRFCIDKNLNPALRRQICFELAGAHVEFGLMFGIKMIIGLMPTLILKSVFEKSGVSLERLGRIEAIGEHSKVQAAGIPINYAQLESVRKKSGLDEIILNEQSYRKAA